MNLSEYLQLRETLEANGTSVAEEFGLSTISINEAGPVAKPSNTPTQLPSDPGLTSTAPVKDLDTQKQTASLVTRWGRMKYRLNKVGANIQKDITQKIISKYLPTILEADRQTFNAISQAAKEGKDISGIKQILRSKQQQTEVVQQKSLGVVYSAIDQFLTNASDRMNKKIESSKMTDKNKANVKNYWLLLQTQIKLNAYNYITNAMNADASKLLGTNPEILKAVQEFNPALQDLTKKKQEDTAKMAEVKQNLATVEADFKAEENPAAAPVVPEVGKKYTYTNAAGKSYEVTITKINVDKSLQAKISTGGSALIPADKIQKLVPVKETPAPSSAASPEPNPAEAQGI